jgi:hypothetical protein
MLAGQANCCRIRTISAQYFPLDRSCQCVIPKVSKREQNCCAGFEMLRSIASGKVLRTYEL